MKTHTINLTENDMRIIYQILDNRHAGIIDAIVNETAELPVDAGTRERGLVLTRLKNLFSEALDKVYTD